MTVPSLFGIQHRTRVGAGRVAPDDRFEVVAVAVVRREVARQRVPQGRVLARNADRLPAGRGVAAGHDGAAAAVEEVVRRREPAEHHDAAGRLLDRGGGVGGGAPAGRDAARGERVLGLLLVPELLLLLLDLAGLVLPRLVPER